MYPLIVLDAKNEEKFNFLLFFLWPGQNQICPFWGPKQINKQYVKYKYIFIGGYTLSLFNFINFYIFQADIIIVKIYE